MWCLLLQAAGAGVFTKLRSPFTSHQRIQTHHRPVHPAGIQRTYTMEGSPPTVQTDGINFGGIWPHTDLIDMSQITTNDVSAVLHTYGVEAARATLMREVRSVFGAYGIGVDPRHLGLIADFMTHQVRGSCMSLTCACRLLHHR